jgi:hypothetical protein
LLKKLYDLLGRRKRLRFLTGLAVFGVDDVQFEVIFVFLHLDAALELPDREPDQHFQVNALTLIVFYKELCDFELLVLFLLFPD